jgi:hypothetical protein
VGLSPVSVVSHCEQATPPHTPRVGGKNRDVLLRDGPLWEPSGASALLGAWHTARGRTVTPPALSLPGPFVTARYRTTLATYLSRRKVRARSSGRARPRPGRIRPSFRKRLTAPFETEPTTPAAHASSRAGRVDETPRKGVMPARSAIAALPPKATQQHCDLIVPSQTTVNPERSNTSRSS